jgi:predicted RNase H-like HicB family nuclease
MVVSGYRDEHQVMTVAKDYDEILKNIKRCWLLPVFKNIS